MANEFIARDGVIIKSVTTGTTENKMIFQNDSGIVKVRPSTDFLTNANDVWPIKDKITNIVTLTQAEYDLIGVKSTSTLYVII
jgi:hypothetical protein